MLITHDLGVIAEMADYVVVMYAGRVVEKGTVQEIFENPAHPYTFFTSSNSSSMPSWFLAEMGTMAAKSMT